MKRSFRDEWVQRLRSGEYEQARCVLKNKDGAYCCLGVAGDVIDSDNWSKVTHPVWVITPPHPDRDYVQAFAFLSDNNEEALELLPYDVASKYGLPRYLQEELSELNDSGKTFSEIADWIEANIEIEDD